jgi:uncharacterized membrane protein
MIENEERISQLLQKAEALKNNQEILQKEISILLSEIKSLEVSEIHRDLSYKPELTSSEVPGIQMDPVPPVPIVPFPEIPPTPDTRPTPEVRPTVKKLKLKSDLEKFIGENLINKIGIAITIIGVGIGAKYAIDHQLISPWTRIILGYLVGLGLFGFALRLRKQYENFSAVLLSGSMAILYFITFAAYTFYDLVPLFPTFGLMVLFTMFTVGAAIKYNRQVIAHIGLVGAYAVPFLLSDGSGKVLVLFTYMLLINAGILVIAFKRYWKALYYAAFILTWLIVVSWYIPGYQFSDHFGLTMIFTPLFFAVFYLIFLAYKLIGKEKYEIEDILVLLVNSGLFYGLGYATLRSDISTQELTGLFTLGNAMVHFAVAGIIWFRKPADRGLLYFIIGLGMAFVTITIPVQLDGHWVTLLWCFEAAALFWTGRTKNMSVYELVSYPLMMLAFFSIIHDWDSVYNMYNLQHPETRIIPLLNIHFLTSLFVVFSFGFIQYLYSLKQYCSPLAGQKTLLKMMDIIIPSVLLIVLYFSFIMEILNFWNQLYVDSLVTKTLDLTVPKHFRNEDFHNYKAITVFNFSLIYLLVLSLVNMRWLKNTLLGLINLVLNTITLGVFLILGLYAFGELRESYISLTLADLYYRGGWNIGIRYFSFFLVGLMLLSMFRYVREAFIRTDFKMEFDLLLHITILTIISNELINWMDLYEPGQSFKLGLSILFGVYALFLVILGIWKKKAHLRIAAIVLFGATLLKLFFYDLTSLDTISKTIVFVSLGILLLVISFLYNKYKRLIFDDHTDPHDK